MLPKAGEALITGMGLKPPQVKLLIRVGWVLIVTGHIAWVCGWLAFFGAIFATPFAKASDVKEIQDNMRVTARISLQSEIRAQGEAYCKMPDGETRKIIYQRIESLRLELKRVEPNAEVPPLRCDI